MKLTLLFSLLTIGMGTALATTTSELVISNAGGTKSCTISASGDVAVGGGCAGITGDTTVGASSIAIVNGTFTDASGTVWNLNVVDGSSNSPATDPGLDVSSETAVCVSGNCNGAQLDIYFGDIGFTSVASGFVNSFSATDAGSGTASQYAWDSSTDTLLAETTAVGKVGPFTGAGTFAGSVAGPGPQGPSPYSLTLEQVFTSDAQHDTFSVDGSITGVPEPGAVILFGTLLAFCATKLRQGRTS